MWAMLREQGRDSANGMQSTWYLFPGQTKKNTKISDRGKALIATPAAWKKITSHLETKKLQERAQEQERARRQYLKDASYQMTKDWDNSIEKIRQRRLEELENKKKIKEEDQMKRFLELRKEQEEERNNYVTEARKKIYMFQEKSRNLNSALLLSEVLFERNLQGEFEKLERQHEMIENAKYAQCVRENAEREKEENIEKRKRIKDQNENYTKELEVQIKKIQDEEKQELEERLKWEKVDNIKADEEMKAIKEYEKKLEVDKKADVRKQFNEFAAIQKQHKEQILKQEEAENKIIQIYEKAKCRIDEKRKQREKEVKAEKIKIREKIAAKVMAEVANNQEIEEKMLAKAKEEYDRREQEKLAKEECYQKELREQRAQNYKQVVARRKKQIEEEVEVKKWELLNRLKTNEVIQKYDTNKKQKEFDEKIEYRKELFEQMAELEKGAEYEKKCKQMELEYYKKKMKKEDREFFAYADEVLDLAKSRGRTIEPILKVVQQYKIDNELVPKKKNHSMLQSNVPINKKSNTSKN